MLYLFGSLVTQRKAFQSLSPSDRAIMTDVISGTVRKLGREARKDNASALIALRKQGINFVTPQARCQAAGRLVRVTRALLGWMPSGLAIVAVIAILIILGVSLASTNALIDAEAPTRLFAVIKSEISDRLTFLILLNLFIASYRFKKPVIQLYRATLPFFAILLTAVLIITYSPDLSLALADL